LRKSGIIEDQFADEEIQGLILCHTWTRKVFDSINEDSALVKLNICQPKSKFLKGRLALVPARMGTCKKLPAAILVEALSSAKLPGTPTVGSQV
jgi:hypothetical protein